MLGQFKNVQARALAVLGLHEPLDNWLYIAPLLRQRADDDRRILGDIRSDRELRYYPSPGPSADGGAIERGVHYVKVQRGFLESEWEAAFRATIDEDGFIGDVPAENLFGKALRSRSATSRPLWRLREYALEIVKACGVSEADAVACLLADEDIVLPWIETFLNYRSPTGTVGVVIEVASIAARPDEVRKAYEAMRRDPFVGLGAGEREFLLRPLESSPVVYKRSSINERAAAMFDFVERRWAARGTSRTTEAEWDEMNETFAATGYERYKNGKTMRVTYQKAHPGKAEGADNGKA